MNRILLLADDDHEDLYCFDNGDVMNAEQIVAFLCYAHSEDYIFKIVRAYEIEFEDNEKYYEFENHFNKVKFSGWEDIKHFDFLWNLSQFT